MELGFIATLSSSFLDGISGWSSRFHHCVDLLLWQSDCFVCCLDGLHGFHGLLLDLITSTALFSLRRQLRCYIFLDGSSYSQ